MLRQRLLAASVLALAAGAAVADVAPGTTTTTTIQPTPAARQAAPPAAKPLKPSPEQRAEVERLDPLARAAFWARAVDVDPTDADARLKLAKALRALGKFEEGGAAADQLLVMQPKNYEALLESARDKVGANQGFYAIDLAERAEALAPKDWRPVAILAVALEEASRDSEALAAHQKALTLAPANPATLSNLGMYYATHGEAAKGEALLRQAAAAPGAGARERQNLALVLGLEGKFDEAERLAREDLPPDQVAANLAYLKAAGGQTPAHSWDQLRSAQQ
jgi:Flp pilus assembly protein TadD